MYSLFLFFLGWNGRKYIRESCDRCGISYHIGPTPNLLLIFTALMWLVYFVLINNRICLFQKKIIVSANIDSKFMGILYYKCFAGSLTIFQPRGRVPHDDPKLPKTKRLRLRLDSQNPSGRVLELPAPPKKLHSWSVYGATGIHIRRAQRPARHRRP